MHRFIITETGIRRALPWYLRLRYVFCTFVKGADRISKISAAEYYVIVQKKYFVLSKYFLQSFYTYNRRCADESNSSQAVKSS